MKKIVCYSGGKDSTAMLIHLLKTNAQIDDIMYVDVGNWTWNNAKDHIKQVEETLGVKITVLDATDELSKGFQRWGFPSIINRWCTGIKKALMRDYIKNKYGKRENIVQYIGYCSDEEKRTDKPLYSAYDAEYPLVDANITNEDALKLCQEYGFDFGGIYEHHKHYNCWLCPLQRVDELYWIWKNEPQLWEQLRQMQLQTNGEYKYQKTIFYFDQKFWEKNRKELEMKRLEARKKYNKKRGRPRKAKKHEKL